MEVFMNVLALLCTIAAVPILGVCLYEAFVVPRRMKKAAAEIVRQQRLQQDAQELEQRLKEARERGARMVEHDQRRAKPQKPQKPATRTSQGRVDVVDHLQIAADFNDDIPVRTSHATYSCPSSSYDSGSSSSDSSSSSSSCD